MRDSEKWLRAAGVCALLLCAGCVARYVRVGEKGLTCVEAHRIAIDAVRRMGYTITEATKATPGSPGVIIATREVGTSKEGMLVHVFCTTQGAEVEARSDTGGLSQLSFANDFRRSFEAAAKNQPPPRPPAESGVDVLLTPERTAELGPFGAELSNAGILPVRLRITNRTERAYRFRAKGVVLRSASGERVAPFALAKVTAQLSADGVQKARKEAAADGTVAPGAALKGLLFFPFQPYTRARVELIDQASDETEGFAIEF